MDPRYPPPTEFYYNPQFPPPRHAGPRVPFQRPPPSGSRWRGGEFRPHMMQYRYPPPQQQFAPHYGSRKRQGNFQRPYGARRGHYGGRGRQPKYHRPDDKHNEPTAQTGPYAYDPFYDESMFEDPWKHLLPQSQKVEESKPTEHTLSNPSLSQGDILDDVTPEVSSGDDIIDSKASTCSADEEQGTDVSLEATPIPPQESELETQTTIQEQHSCHDTV